MILDFGFCKSCAFDNRPHDRLRPAIKLAGCSKLQQLTSNPRFRVEVHGRVWGFKIAADCEALELFRLDLDPASRKFTTFLAEFVDCNFVLVLALCAVLFLDLPLDRQAVAIPARHIIRVEAAHLK
ncbi:hypothetical protein D3C72_2001720 [compost metagenome]